jgi:hypothetical protein
VLEVLASARVLHDAVERHELRYDDPSHVVLLVDVSECPGTIINQRIDKPVG